MTKTEQDAQFIKAQRSKIFKAYCQLMTIILNNNLSNYKSRKYDFEGQISSTGNHFDFTIRLADTHEQTQKFEYWLLADIFEEDMFTGINKRRCAEKVKKCLSVISSAKKAILECIKVNES